MKNNKSNKAFENIKLNIEFEKDKTFKGVDFMLRGRKTLITGDSGTGKTFAMYLITTFMRLKGDGCECNHGYDRFAVIDAGIDAYENEEILIEVLKKHKGKIMFIDEIDDLLKDSEKLNHYIELDLDSTYIIACRDTRTLSFGATPANVAEVVYDEDRFLRLKYKYDIGGW